VSISGLTEQDVKKKCPGGGLACLMPVVLFVALIVLYLTEAMNFTAALVLGVLDIAWILASLRCLCLPYLPFIEGAEEREGCPGAGIACFIPFLIAILAIVFLLLSYQGLLAALIVAGLVIVWIALSWRCLCRPYLPFLKK
jgi:hypothetical protein